MADKYSKKPIITFRDKGISVAISYNFNSEYSYVDFVYLGDKINANGFNINSEKYGREKIEKCWKDFYVLREKGELDLKKLCNTLEGILFEEDQIHLEPLKRLIDEKK